MLIVFYKKKLVSAKPVFFAKSFFATKVARRPFSSLRRRRKKTPKTIFDVFVPKTSTAHALERKKNVELTFALNVRFNDAVFFVVAAGHPDCGRALQRTVDDLRQLLGPGLQHRLPRRVGGHLQPPGNQDQQQPRRLPQKGGWLTFASLRSLSTLKELWMPGLEILRGSPREGKLSQWIVLSKVPVRCNSTDVGSNHERDMSCHLSLTMPWHKVW